MSIEMNIAEAKAKFYELIARVEAGEQVIIARDGKPVVSLTPVQVSSPAKRRLGLWDHVGAEIPEDRFIGPDSDIERAVELWDAVSVYPAP